MSLIKSVKRKIALIMKQTPEEIEAEKILNRVENESETVGTSSMKRVAERTKNQIPTENSGTNEWAEKWGTMIGRGLGTLFVIVLIIHLVRTYVLNG